VTPRSPNQDEAEEIAGYTAIEALAESLGDDETAKLARSIRRDKKQMARFLERLIPTLTKAVAHEEIPAPSDGQRVGADESPAPAGGRESLEAGLSAASRDRRQASRRQHGGTFGRIWRRSVWPVEEAESGVLDPRSWRPKTSG